MQKIFSKLSWNYILCGLLEVKKCALPGETPKKKIRLKASSNPWPAESESESLTQSYRAIEESRIRYLFGSFSIQKFPVMSYIIICAINRLIRLENINAWLHIQCIMVRIWWSSTSSLIFIQLLISFAEQNMFSKLVCTNNSRWTTECSIEPGCVSFYSNAESLFISKTKVA